jgi:predicted DNA-binding protein (MmcQ/YjbR family)
MPKAMSPAEAALRKHALSYPEAHEDFPWGERVVKVKGKVFLFLGKHEEKLGLSVKLPSSASFALGLPFASPTAYGLGKSGWVTARFARREKPPIDLLMKWIDESYRAVAPKRLVAALADGAPPAPSRGRSRPKSPRKR